MIGIAVAVLIGYGIYTGGVKLDLGRFFTGTGVFLVFVAGGLVLTALRHAHEAGWLVIGQQRTVDLGWLAPNGSLRGALVTGVLGIPADPRVVEVLGWVLYVVPVLAISLWPRAWRPSPQRVPRVRAVLAAAFAATAVVLAVAVPSGSGADLPRTVAVSGDARSVTASVAGDSAVLRVASGGREARITLPASAHRRVARAGTTADQWQVTEDVPSADRPTSLTLDQLVGLFGRVPVGVSPSTNPGPFAADWTVRDTVTLTTVDGGVSRRAARNATCSRCAVGASRPLGRPRWDATSGPSRPPTRTVRRPPSPPRRRAPPSSDSGTPGCPSCCSSRRPPRPRSRSATGAASPSPRPPPPEPTRRADRPPTSLQGASTMPFGSAARPLAARPLIALGALGAVAALTLTACSAGTPADDASSGSGKVSRVTITLTNDGSDACAVSTTKVPAGPVTFRCRTSRRPRSPRSNCCRTSGSSARRRTSRPGSPR